MIHMVILWYDRNNDFDADYNSPHQEIIVGDTPSECMEQYRSMQENHDLMKYTRREIAGIF